MSYKGSLFQITTGYVRLCRVRSGYVKIFHVKSS
jgi:hypothetical protein